MKNSNNKEIYTDSIVNLECEYYRPYMTQFYDPITYIKCSDNFLEMLKNRTLKIHSISRKKRVYFINKNVSNYFYYSGTLLGLTTGKFNSILIRKMPTQTRLFKPDKTIKLKYISFSSEDKKIMAKIKLMGLENYIKNC